MTMKKTLTVLVPSVLALFVASAANAAATFDTPQGKLILGGDVEYNLDAQNFGDTDSGSASNTVSDVQSANGRILLDVEGERLLANGNFAGFKINPVYTTNGDYGDGEDSWFSFGVKNDWAFKMGHYEAYDLSPAGQDTYVVGYGDDLYRAKAARGRANSGSQVMLSKEAGQWHMEVSTLFGDDNGMYDSVANVQKNKDPLVARPVVAWTGDTVSVAVGAEINLITDAYLDSTGEDVSDWSGYGATAAIKATDDLSFSVRGAFKNADEGNGYSVGPGVAYQNFYVAYLNGKNENDATNVDTKYNIAYASYKVPAVMGIDNFDMYLGTSWGNKKIGDASATEEYGARVRFKYFF
jgi:hypothetical protein